MAGRRGGRRPKHADGTGLTRSRRLASGSRQQRRGLLGFALIERVYPCEDHACERRIGELLAITELALDEAVYVVTGGESYRVSVGRASKGA
jgi:hypothetical protein